jgi:hypothetical protein
MKTFLHSRDGASQGAALMIVLALVVLLTGLALAYFSRTTTDRQLAQSSYNDTSADLLARSALDIVVGDFKQEIINNPTVGYANIQPARYGDASIPNLIRRSFPGDPTNRTSSVSSMTVSANGRSISTTRWNSHYLIPRGNPSDPSINPSPTPAFIAPNWVLVTAQGPTPAPSPNAVIGRYAFAVYDEGGLLDMTLAGYPSWSSCNTPTPTSTPWLVNVGRKGIMAFADLTALGSYAPPQSQIDNIVGWRNYAMTQRTSGSFGNFTYTGETDCSKQDFYGSYLLNFGDPPFGIESLSDKLLASTYPFTSAATYVLNGRTDQSLISRQELLRLQRVLNNPPGQFSQNVLQYMGTFSRERNRPAPDWPGLNPTGALSEGRFNLNNLAMAVPNPDQCIIPHGKKKGWQTGKNKNKLCGTPAEVVELLGLFWIRADVIDPHGRTPGNWRYIGNVGGVPNPDQTPNPHRGIDCFRGANQQNDFFQILYFGLFGDCDHNRPDYDNRLAKTFAIGASLIDQYDSGAACVGSNPGPSWGSGCDMDRRVQSQKYATHTTVIEYGRGNGNLTTAYGMEVNYSASDLNASVNGDDPCDASGNNPHRPSPAPVPITGGPNPTIVMNHAFSNVGELGYGIVTSALPIPGPSASCAPTPGPTAVPTLDFSSPNFPNAPVLDCFSYNPISSAYPRAGIVNLYTKNAPVLAAILASTWKTEAASANPNPAASPSGRVLPSEAMTAANDIITETQNVLAGTPTYGPVTQTDMTRAIAARLATAGNAHLNWSTEQKQSIARALAEMGQTRTWNLFIDVIAQTGKYAPGTTDVTQANKFTVEGEKRYWLHIALGRDLNPDGSVDVLGTQLEEIIE